jgi:heme-degrading monooxygenase HmoA
VIQVVWEFRVKPHAIERFEQAYGPAGDWAVLFARYQGFRGTTLLRDVAVPGRYVTIDSWESRRHRDDMLVRAQAEYTRLDSSCAGWMESEAEVGVFEERPQS